MDLPLQPEQLYLHPSYIPQDGVEWDLGRIRTLCSLIMERNLAW